MGNNNATGTVVKAFGNLLYVNFDGAIRQGELADVKVGDLALKAEVIEIKGDEAKVQVFEDTRGISLGTHVQFNGNLLEAELGPGLLTSIFDGLQNPLEDIAQKVGLFLKRGIYVSALDRTKKWEYQPEAKVGDVVTRGDALGSTMEGHFKHQIMVPFDRWADLTLTWIISRGSYTVDTVVAKAVDADGREYEFTMVQRWPIKAPIFIGEKVKATRMMVTGERIIDTQLPVLKGGSFCTPGPFGAGKTVLQHHLSKYSDVDIVIVAACGERAGEVVEVLRTFPELSDPKHDEPLMNRTVIICNTSSMPVAAREASIYLGATIAEYYRQMGLDVLLLADSTSRWAQAMREMSGRLEEIPGEEAFPAYLGSRISAFYERAGVVQTKNGQIGSLTIGGAVSPAGGNFEEPVTQATLAVVGAFLGLSRERSDARKYPAIDPLISWSKYVEDVAHELGLRVEGWGDKVTRALKTLCASDEIGKRMEVVGVEGIPMQDMLTYLKGELYEFSYLQQNAFDSVDAYCSLERQIPLFELVNRVFDLSFNFKTQDEARSFFLELQSEIKNMNSMPFKSDKYKEIYSRINQMIEQHN